MPSLVVRNLIKFGEGGLAVTIPKGWVRYNGLKPKDKVTMIINDELRIIPGTKQVLEKSKEGERFATSQTSRTKGEHHAR